MLSTQTKTVRHRPRSLISRQTKVQSIFSGTMGISMGRPRRRQPPLRSTTGITYGESIFSSMNRWSLPPRRKARSQSIRISISLYPLPFSEVGTGTEVEDSPGQGLERDSALFSFYQVNNSHITYLMFK